jgi:hypothetical protein
LIPSHRREGKFIIVSLREAPHVCGVNYATTQSRILIIF